MDTITLNQFIGLLGVCSYIATFAALQTGYLDGNGKLYCLANIVSAAMVLISLTEQFNLASAIIQLSWITIGAFGLCSKFLRPRVHADKVKVPEDRQRNGARLQA